VGFGAMAFVEFGFWRLMIHHIADLSICWEIVFLMHNVPYTHFISIFNR